MGRVLSTKIVNQEKIPLIKAESQVCIYVTVQSVSDVKVSCMYWQICIFVCVSCWELLRPIGFMVIQTQMVNVRRIFHLRVERITIWLHSWACIDRLMHCNHSYVYFGTIASFKFHIHSPDLRYSCLIIILFSTGLSGASHQCEFDSTRSRYLQVRKLSIWLLRKVGGSI